MKIFGIILLYALLGLHATAQQTGSQAISPVVSDGNSLVIHGRSDVIAENSPYIPSGGWQSGYFIQQNGKRFEMTEMRFDTYLQRLEYRQDDKTYYPKAPIIGFGFSDKTVYRNQFLAFDKHDTSTFFQILYEGNVRLIKHTMSTVSDVTSYNSATKTVHFNEHTTYYFLNEQGVMGKSKKLDDTLLKAFGTKQEAVRTYIKQNNLTWKNPASLLQIMSYYESL